MEEVKNFLRVSTIHGLFHVNTEKTWGKIFWIFVVFGGFTWAGYMIHTSIQSWYETPISTTIESLPISEIKLPNITICPPKDSILNLNYDIVKAENIKFDMSKRNEWLEYSMKVVQEKFYDEIMKNLTKVEDPHRFYNWYYGYAKITYPFYSTEDIQLFYILHISAPFGNISTLNYGKKYDKHVMDGDISVNVIIHVPTSKIYSIYTTTIKFDLEKITIEENSDNDQMSMDTVGIIDPGITHFSKNVTSARIDSYTVVLNRKIPSETINDIKLDMMPGFRLIWEYETQLGLPINIWNYEFVR